MDRGEIIEQLTSAEYVFAKTMPRMPHWYTLKRKWADPKAFEECVEFIRANGQPKKFRGREYIYFVHEEWQFWTMGAAVEETILINRAKL
jgi:hypothetical protein